MPTIETTAAFFGVAVLLALAPGPDNLFVMVHAAVHGRRAGMLVVLGLCTGLVVHTTAVALGLAAVFAASATAFEVLKLCGAVYLAYLAFQAFRRHATATSSGGTEPMGDWRTYGRGIVMNVTNPKVAVFFLAFLPQFANPAAGSMTLQFFFLGGVFIVATLVTFGAIAHFSGAFGTLLRRSPRVQRVLDWAAGAIFLGLAARLAMAER
jgi:threonine/homoserine/homoserine lactone efflux protein